MGLLTDFILAPESEAQVICSGEVDHVERWPALQLKGVDPIKLDALATALYETKGLKALVPAAEMLCSEEEGPWVFRISKDFVRMLAQAGPEKLATVGHIWSAGEEMVLSRWTEEDGVLRDLSGLCVQALNDQSPVLLWMCL